MNISEYMRGEHRACDTLFANAEKAVLQQDWEAATNAFEHFSHETLTHFKKEEEELFPAFEAHTGNTEGPTKVMQYEHQQVRGLIGRMAEALDAHKKEDYISTSEVLMILLQQHNMKEEQMLYRMCEAMLPAELQEKTLHAMKKMQ